MGRRVKLSKYRRPILGLILAVAVLVRLHGITNPLLDDQAWRQADTASIATHMLGHLFNFPDVLIPKLNYDGTVPQNVELEFPLFPYLLAWTWTLFGWADIWGRLWAVFLTVLAIWGLEDLGRNLFSDEVGLLAAGIYSLMPLFIYYGRVVMPEPLAQALSIWALAFMVRWRRTRRTGDLWKVGVMMAGAVLAKLPQLMLLPVALLLGFYPWQRKQLRSCLLYALFALSIPVVYYIWVHKSAGSDSQFVSGILTNQVAAADVLNWKGLVKNLRRGFTDSALFLSGLGFLRLLFKSRRERLPLAALTAWVGISLLYLGVICVRIPLDYYLIPVMPAVALLGAYALAGCKTQVRLLLVLALLLILNRGSYTYLKAKYTWNPAYLTQASWIKEHTPAGSVLLLSVPAPMTFYYSGRVGFRLTEDEQGIYEDFPSRLARRYPADYFIKLPQSQQDKLFWQNVQDTYREVGPGVYALH